MNGSLVTMMYLLLTCVFSIDPKAGAHFVEKKIRTCF